MAEDGPLTPEKQLLRLIEDAKGAQQGGAAKKPGGSRPSLRLPSFGGLRGAFTGRLSFFRRTAKKKLAAAPKKKVDLAAVNRILALATAAIFLYVAGDAVASAMALRKPLPFVPEKGAARAEGPASVSPLSEASFYLEKAASRDIFREGGTTRRDSEAEAEASIEPANDPATSGLSLVGISWSSNPDVIIEDKDSKRTYFVKRGQVVGKGVKVEAVFKDHVVLSYEGREFELR